MIIYGARSDFMRYHFFGTISRFTPAMMINSPEELTAELLVRVKPEWVFLTDWSTIVPPELLALAQFAGFHAADLPDYRGGSPLQHQIFDGLVKTKLTCYRMTDRLDAGSILMQEDLDLSDSVTAIWNRMAALIPNMIFRIVDGEFTERPQRPGGFIRKRRTPDQSRIPRGIMLQKFYDYIRALDNPYPNAFTVFDGKRFAFSEPTYDNGKITARVEITTEESHV